MKNWFVIGKSKLRNLSVCLRISVVIEENSVSRRNWKISSLFGSKISGSLDIL